MEQEGSVRQPDPTLNPTRGAEPCRIRVTPFGTFGSVAARGTVMGNRGCLHGRGGVVRFKPFDRLAWIACDLYFKGRQRPIHPPGNSTQLFALD